MKCRVESVHKRLFSVLVVWIGIGAIGQEVVLVCAGQTASNANSGIASQYPIPRARESSDATKLSDWNAYRGDNGRTGFLDVAFAEPLRQTWVWSAPAPSPAWPPPASKSYWQNLDSIEPRIVDDQALHPVVANDSVLVGSSADDSVICLDRASGKLRWRVTTDGPVRFAPAVWNEKVLIASDDGFLRCVRLTDGSIIWSQRVGPELDRVPGNGRLISPFPLRSGVLVADGVAYACAGLFPSQGVFAAAYDISSGERLWHRSLGQRSPQGYMLAAEDRLIVPNGRGNPFSLRIDNGEDGPAFQGVGGTYAVIEDDRLVAGRGNDNSLVSSQTRSGERVVTFPGEHLAVTPRHSFVSNRTSIAAIDRARSNDLRSELAAIQQKIDSGESSDQLLERKREIDREIIECILWTVPSDRVLSLAAANNCILVGLSDALELRDLSDGSILQRIETNGEVRSIALANDQIFVTTHRGDLISFAITASESQDTQEDDRKPVVTSQVRERVASWFAKADTDRGYALLVEPSIEELFAAAEFDGFQIVAAIEDDSRLTRIRAALHTAGIYGIRVSAHKVGSERLPFTDHFANLVVDESQMFSRDEIERVAAPGRGVVLQGGVVERTSSLDGAGSWTHQFGNLANTANGNDQYTTNELRLQWFGGPGPRRMVDRHLRAPPPMAIGGRTIMVGENRLIGVDSYNGTELWDTELPDSQRYAMPYDTGYIACHDQSVFAAVDDALWQVAIRNGAIIERRALPDSVREGCHWGYVGVTEDAVFGTAMLPSAPRTNPGRHLSDQTYRSEQPLVTSKAFFRTNVDTGEQEWIYRKGVIVHPTIAIHNGIVFFLEARGDECLNDELGRIPLSKLLDNDAWIVALDAQSGELVWEQPADLPDCKNVVYFVCAEDQLILVGSGDNERRDAKYHVFALDAKTGEERWRDSHDNNQPGQLYHGEQVHHPVVLGGTLVAEPYMYNLESGERIVPEGEDADWSIKRPGHSCGTMSGSNSCLFFRAGNPTVLDTKGGEDDRFRALSPSRVGCWINILPADGLVIIPEASSSCVCHYALQTSMAFRPLPKQEATVQQ